MGDPCPMAAHSPSSRCILSPLTLESDSGILNWDARDDLDATHMSMHSALVDAHGSGHVRDAGSSIGAGSAAPAAGFVTEFVGRPTYFERGPFAGLTVRAALEEIQGPNAGRICPDPDPTERDGLDPPPVVLLHLYKLVNDVEHEISYSEADMLGMVCSVDLLRVPDNYYTYGSGGTASSGLSHGSSSQICPSTSQSLAASGSESADYVVHHVNGFPVYESSRCMKQLAGRHRTVQASFVRYMRRNAIIFAFDRLAVRMTGTFVLHYRFFDLAASPCTQPAAANSIVIQAELYGSPFRVFSDRKFPGYQVSTELTRQLSSQGVPLIIRTTARQKKNKREEKPHSTVPLKRRR